MIDGGGVHHGRGCHHGGQRIPQTEVLTLWPVCVWRKIPARIHLGSREGRAREGQLGLRPYSPSKLSKLSKLLSRRQRTGAIVEGKNYLEKIDARSSFNDSSSGGECEAFSNSHFSLKMKTLVYFGAVVFVVGGHAPLAPASPSPSPSPSSRRPLVLAPRLRPPAHEPRESCEAAVETGAGWRGSRVINVRGSAACNERLSSAQTFFLLCSIKR